MRADRVYGADHWRPARYRSALGACLTALGRHADAERELLAAWPRLSENLGVSHVETRRTAERLAEHYDAVGKTTEAAEWRKRAEPVNPASHPASQP